MMKQSLLDKFLPFACLAIIVILTTVDCDKAGQQLSDSDYGFKSPCGTAAQVSERLGKGIADLFGMLEGKISTPKNDEDMVVHSNKFEKCEKCARVVAKECLHGIHKTATGAVATSTRRFRLKEFKTPASRAKYIEPLKCLMKNSKDMTNILQNHTAIVQTIRDLTIAPEQKLMKMCCVLNSFDTAITNALDRDCPKSTPYVISISHGMTDDARGALCVAPKCGRALEGLTRNKYKPPQNFIEPIMQILFQINTDE